LKTKDLNPRPKLYAGLEAYHPALPIRVVWSLSCPPLKESLKPLEKSIPPLMMFLVQRAGLPLQYPNVLLIPFWSLKSLPCIASLNPLRKGERFIPADNFLPILSRAPLREYLYKFLSVSFFARKSNFLLTPFTTSSCKLFLNSFSLELLRYLYSDSFSFLRI
jgi:hypothetical protein